MGYKTIEIKKRGPEIDLRLRRLFELCDFDIGRVNCTSMVVWSQLIINSSDMLRVLTSLAIYLWIFPLAMHRLAASICGACVLGFPMRLIIEILRHIHDETSHIIIQFKRSLLNQFQIMSAFEQGYYQTLPFWWESLSHPCTFLLTWHKDTFSPYVILTTGLPGPKI